MLTQGLIRDGNNTCRLTRHRSKGFKGPTLLVGLLSDLMCCLCDGAASSGYVCLFPAPVLHILDSFGRER